LIRPAGKKVIYGNGLNNILIVYYKRMPTTQHAVKTPVRTVAEIKTPAGSIEGKMWHDGQEVFSLYERLNFKLVSVRLYAEKDKNTGKMEKKATMAKWKTESNRIANLKAGTHYAFVTGERGGCSVIDIDDPNTETAKELMDLMIGCTMVAKTRKGFHYVYKYTDKIKQTANKKYNLDIRNHGGLTFCQPSQLHHKGEVIAHYKWIKEPMEDELEEIPQEVVDYLDGLDGGYTVKSVPKQNTILQHLVEEDEDEDVGDSISEVPSASTSTEPKPIEEHELVTIVKALPNAVISNYQDWLDIGIIFYNKKLTCADWDEVSNRPNVKYEAGACAKKWGTFTDKRSKQLTEATLWHKLKKHNPTKFYELMETRQDFLNMLQLLNSNDVAKYFYNINPDKYVYNEHLGWYSLNPNNIWTRSEKSTPSGIKGDISNTFQQLCLDTKKAVLTKFAKDASQTADKDKHSTLKDACDQKIKLIHASYKTLGSADFCSGVISFLDTYYNDPTLEERIDTNPYLFAFTDSLYDLQKGEFRPITPQDMICTTTGYAKPKSVPKIRKEVEEFITGLHDDAETTEYLLKILASALLGYNKFEKFYIFSGKGGNGKGVIADLMRVSFGKYYYPAEMSLFTKIRERVDQPVPALVEARNCRIMMTTEPESSERLQVSTLKKISGGDPMECRTLNSKHIYKFKPMYKPFFQMNDIPKFSKIDLGLGRRMEVVGFPHSYVADPKEPHERKGDPDIKNVKAISDAWRNEFILLLTEVYSKHVKDAKHLIQPTSVKATTGACMDDNNPLKFWLAKHYTITNKKEDTIQSSLLMSDYMADENKDKCDSRWFKQMLSFNGIDHDRIASGAVYMGLVRKEKVQELQIK